VRAVVYGVGAMGALVVPELLARDAEIVGAIARSPAKVGRDLGDVAGIGRALGVRVDDDPDAVFAAEAADVAVLAVNSGLPAHAPHIAACLRHGVNVVTICEEALFPWWSAPDLTAELDALARAHGVSILGTGHQDAFWLGVGLALLGASGTVEAVAWESLWSPEGGGAELLVALGIGAAPTADSGAGYGAHLAASSLDAVAASLGLDPGERTVTSEPLLAEQPRYCAALGRDIVPGEVIGVRDTVERRRPGEPHLTFTMTGRLLSARERPGERWAISGPPELRLSTSYDAGHVQVVAQAVNRIPDVLDAPPGWLRHDALPPLRRHGALFMRPG
jgi:4-hydroxy-tetrahydrodipicolinate reductase